MKREIRDLWVAALESGRYHHCKASLKMNYAFNKMHGVIRLDHYTHCGLGVLLEEFYDIPKMEPVWEGSLEFAERLRISWNTLVVLKNNISSRFNIPKTTTAGKALCCLLNIDEPKICIALSKYYTQNDTADNYDKLIAWLKEQPVTE